MPPPTRSKRANNNSTTQAASVIAALTALEQGEAKTKKDAAAAAGTSTTALKPSRLATIARNPILRALIRTDPLDISAEISRADGSKARVSMREVLSQGATRVVQKMADLQAKVGDWTKAERETFQQCEKWLSTCRAMGLFRDGEGPPLPADLMNGGAAEPESSIEWWLQDTTRHDQPPGLLTVLPASKGEAPEDEGTKHAGNV